MNKKDEIKPSNYVGVPVRRIGISTRSITGTMPNGNRYESSLERDLMILLSFNPLIHSYTPQPITIPYQASDGSWHRYTPDGLIEYRNNISIGDGRLELVEVKYRKDFIGQSKYWLAKFRAAHRFAKSNGWQFKIYTDDKIRTPFLENARFLIPYLDHESDSYGKCLLDKLIELNMGTPKELLAATYPDEPKQAQSIPSLWALIAQRKIGCDLSKPITMSTKIWCLQPVGE